MKKFNNFILLLLILFPIIVANKVVASNLDKGKILFAQNCNACHKGGRNVIIPEKNLSILRKIFFSFNEIFFSIY